jgi:hypothetical protein
MEKYLVSKELLQKCLNIIAEAPVAFRIVLPVVQEIERLQPYVEPKVQTEEAPSTNC